MAPDPLVLKEKIVNFIKIHGPSLPVHIARETGLSILFASAFLSELYSEKRINISDMKVGGSPLYLAPGQDALLENFWQHLKSKEKDAFLLLKEKRILKDSEQHPAIRVALRGIRDFAIPFQKDEQIFWKYLTVSDDEMSKAITAIPNEIKVEKIESIEKPEEKKEIPEEKIIEAPIPIQVIEEKYSVEEIITDTSSVEKEIIKNKDKEPQKKETPPKIKKEKKKPAKKDNDKFFEKVKEFLSKKSLEIINVEDAGRNELTLKVKEGEKEWMLIAMNKRRITEDDVIKAHKKILGTGLKYRILSLGESTKRMENLIEASKDLEMIEKIG